MGWVALLCAITIVLLPKFACNLVHETNLVNAENYLEIVYITGTAMYRYYNVKTVFNLTLSFL